MKQELCVGDKVWVYVLYDEDVEAQEDHHIVWGGAGVVRELTEMCLDDVSRVPGFIVQLSNDNATQLIFNVRAHDEYPHLYEGVDTNSGSRVQALVMKV